MIYHSIYRYAVVLICGLYLLFFMHIYQPNMGGAGLHLPFNIVSWMAICTIILIATLLSFSGRVVIASRSLIFFLVGVCILTIPLFYPGVRWINSLERTVGVIGGVIFYAILQQCNLIKKNKKLLLIFILLATWIEVIFSLLQIFYFKSGNWMEFSPGARPHGIFQQVNVLASFIATGIGVAAYLFFDNSESFASQSIKRAKDTIYLMSIGLFVFIILLIASRIGYLGTSTVLLVLLGCFGRQHKTRTLLVIMAVTCGLFASTFPLPLPWMENFSHEGSNIQRIMMIKQSFLMIAAKPWLGWGYGSFEYHFQHFVGAQQPLVVNYELVKHPHNEILYWWVEGGVVALGGLVLIGVGYLLPLFTSFSRGRLALWGLTLPIALHTMTEYPLYLSTPHYFVLIILLALVDNYRNHKAINLPATTPLGLSLRLGMVFFIGTALVFLFTALKTNKVLTEIERSGMVDFSRAEALINPYAQWQRYSFDKNTNLLLNFNKTRDIANLLAYERWADEYSKTYIDPTVYLYRIKIAGALSDKSKRYLIEQEALKVLPFGNSEMSQLISGRG